MKEQEKKQEQAKPKVDGKTLSGAEEKSSWLQTAEAIAGNNKIMEGLLKILLSPVTLVVGAGALIFCFIKIKGQKDEIKKLKAENEKLLQEKNEQEEDYLKVKKKYKKLKELSEYEHENPIHALGMSPQKLLLPSSGEVKKKTYKTSYLD